MIKSLKITINGGEPIVAGPDDADIISIIACATFKYSNGEIPESEKMIEFEIAGIKNRNESEPAHVRWSKRNLNVGDTILIQIVD